MDKEKVYEIIVPQKGLKFKTEDGKVIAMLRATEDGGVLGIFDNQGKLIFRKP